MANSLLTINMITRQAVELFKNSNAFLMNVDRQFDDEFGRAGYKIGQNLRIRLPNDYSVTTGPALSLQDTAETSVSLPVATQKHVDIAFTSVEKSLSLDDYTKRVLAPAINSLCGQIAADVMSGSESICNQIANLDGSGNTINPTAKTWSNANAILTKNSAPMGARMAITDPLTNANTMASLSGLFNPSTRITEQYESGTVKNALGFDWMDDQTVLTHTAGTFSAGTVNGAGQTGTTLVTNAITGTLKKGDIITIAGVNAVNRVTKVDTGQLRQFVVTADVATSATSIPIYPAIVVSPAPYSTVTASPANSAAITLVNKASEVTRKNFVLAPQAVTMAFAELEIPKGGIIEGSRVTEYDTSLRIISGYLPGTDQFYTRIDVVYGYVWVRPEWAVNVMDSL